ncbi:MAG: hypothetical protein VYE64_09430, partial [Planctomycetota bacterium]|nr:hypothetical protein [Planctomycetota bacterium]
MKRFFISDRRSLKFPVWLFLLGGWILSGGEIAKGQNPGNLIYLGGESHWESLSKNEGLPILCNLEEIQSPTRSADDLQTAGSTGIQFVPVDFTTAAGSAVLQVDPAVADQATRWIEAVARSTEKAVEQNAVILGCLLPYELESGKTAQRAIAAAVNHEQPTIPPQVLLGSHPLRFTGFACGKLKKQPDEKWTIHVDRLVFIPSPTSAAMPSIQKKFMLPARIFSKDQSFNIDCCLTRPLGSRSFEDEYFRAIGFFKDAPEAGGSFGSLVKRYAYLFAMGSEEDFNMMNRQIYLGLNGLLQDEEADAQQELIDEFKGQGMKSSVARQVVKECYGRINIVFRETRQLLAGCRDPFYCLARIQSVLGRL